MKMEDVPLFGYTIDKSQVPPIHQKRILAFVNHFIVSTCSFLNDFALKCESRFIDVERKLQKVEASLVIIESKLASIPDLESKIQSAPPPIQAPNQENQAENPADAELDKEIIEAPTDTQELQGVKACEDERYRKYFKMMQFGVPQNAVKLKMQAEGFDPNILDAPDAILPDGIPHENENA